MQLKPKLLYVVLNWGLGHASRSIPVINALLQKEFTVEIASDGLSLKLLQKSFPQLQFHTLPALEVEYAKKGSQAIHLIKKGAAYLRWFKADKLAIKKLIDNGNFDGIISDNRPSAYSKQAKCAYITHQVTVNAGFASNAASRIHQKAFAKYDEVWIPDYEQNPGIAGELSHGIKLTNAKYLGPLSVLKAKKAETEFDIGIVLSGPEPQRTLFENEIIHQLAETDKRVLVVRGTNKPLALKAGKNWTIKDLASSTFIQHVFESCKVLVARCGYSTLMDLEHFYKPALLVPTPGQPEQLYLSSLKRNKACYAIQKQERLDLTKGIETALQKAQSKRGDFETNWDDLFSLFKGEGKG